MTRPSKLRAVVEAAPVPVDELAQVKRIGPALTPITLEQSWRMYSTEANACKWRAAITYMRSQSPSLWALDHQQERKP
jgi:hypothetical protein